MNSIKYIKSKLGYGVGAIGLDLSYGMFYPLINDNCNYKKNCENYRMYKIKWIIKRCKTFKHYTKPNLEACKGA